MGSVRHRLAEARQDCCNVVLVGDVRVGKTALVNRFIQNRFTEVRRTKIVNFFLAITKEIIAIVH